MNALLLVLLVVNSPGQAAEQQPAPETLGVVMAAPGPHEKALRSSPSTQRAPTAPMPPETAACPGEGVLFLPTGFILPALLPEAIYSYNTNAPVVALIEDDVKFRDRVVLPKGTHLIGNASTLHTLDRVNILWQTAVLPDGCEFNFAGIALSADDGSAGVKGKLEKHEDSVAAQIALKSMLAAGTVAASAAAPVEGALTSGFTNEANQTLDQSISKVKSLESIYVHERTAIRVFVLRRFVVNGDTR